MIDRQFCELLEYRLTAAFKSAGDDTLHSFWCDGILPPENGAVNGKRSIVLEAFVGQSGQTPYRLILHLGNKAISRSARQLSLDMCIPDTAFDNWIRIDILRAELEVQLT